MKRSWQETFDLITAMLEQRQQERKEAARARWRRHWRTHLACWLRDVADYVELLPPSELL